MVSAGLYDRDSCKLVFKDGAAGVKSRKTHFSVNGVWRKLILSAAFVSSDVGSVRSVELFLR